jgi:hypothetical protein
MSYPTIPRPCPDCLENNAPGDTVCASCGVKLVRAAALPPAPRVDAAAHMRRGWALVWAVFCGVAVASYLVNRTGGYVDFHLWSFLWPMVFGHIGTLCYFHFRRD